MFQKRRTAKKTAGKVFGKLRKESKGRGLLTSCFLGLLCLSLLLGDMAGIQARAEGMPAEEETPGIYETALESILNERRFVIDTLLWEDYRNNPYASANNISSVTEDFDQNVYHVLEQNPTYVNLARAWSAVDNIEEYVKAFCSEVVDVIFTDDDISDLVDAIHKKQYDAMLSGIMTSSYTSSQGNESNDGYETLNYLGTMQGTLKNLKEISKKYKTGTGIYNDVLTIQQSYYVQEYFDKYIDVTDGYLDHITKYCTDMKFVINNKYNPAKPEDRQYMSFVEEVYPSDTSTNIWVKESFFGDLFKMGKTAAKYVSIVDKFSKASMKQVNVVMSMINQGEEMDDFLRRSTKYGDNGYNLVANRYRRLLSDATSEGATDGQTLLYATVNAGLDYAEGVVSGIAKDKFDDFLSSSVKDWYFSDITKDSALRKVAFSRSIKKVLIGLGLINTFDDNLGGFKMLGASLSEQDYLTNIKSTFIFLYKDDLEKYQNCTGSAEEKNELAKNVLYDLEMIRNTKLYAFEHAYELESKLFNDTLAGTLAQVIGGKFDSASLDEIYQDYMDTLIDMKLLPYNMYQLDCGDNAERIVISLENGRYIGTVYTKDGQYYRIPEFEYQAASGIRLRDHQKLEVLCDFSFEALCCDCDCEVFVAEGRELNMALMQSKGSLSFTGKGTVSVANGIKANIFSVGPAKVLIQGDFIMDGNANYGDGTGKLVMDDAEGYLLVEGDFSYTADALHHRVGGASELAKGTLELKGNVDIQTIMWESWQQGWNASDEFLLILSGDEVQTVSCNNPLDCLGRVMVDNPGIIAPMLNINVLESDIQLFEESTNLTIGNAKNHEITSEKLLKLGGIADCQRVHINGDVEQYGDVNIPNGAAFLVDGNYTIKGGILELKNGRVELAKNLTNVENSVNPHDIHMMGKDGYLLVKGDAYLEKYTITTLGGTWVGGYSRFEQGTLEINGSLVNTNDAWEMSKDFVTILNSKEAQKVDVYRSKFGKVVVKSPALITNGFAMAGLETDLKILPADSNSLIWIAVDSAVGKTISCEKEVIVTALEEIDDVLFDCDVKFYDIVIPEESFVQINGNLRVENKDVTVKGELYIQGDVALIEESRLAYRLSVKEGAKLRVDGNLKNYGQDFYLYLDGYAVINGDLEINRVYMGNPVSLLAVEGHAYIDNGYYLTEGCIFASERYYIGNRNKNSKLRILTMQEGLNCPKEYITAVGDQIWIPCYVKGYELIDAPKLILGDTSLAAEEDGIRKAAKKGQTMLTIIVTAQSRVSGEKITLTTEIPFEVKGVPDVVLPEVKDVTCAYATLEWDVREDDEYYQIYSMSEDGTMQVVGYELIYDYNRQDSRICRDIWNVVPGSVVTLYVEPNNEYGAGSLGEGITVRIPEHQIAEREAVLPEEDTPGYTKEVYCTVCGKVFEEANPIYSDNRIEALQEDGYSLSIGSTIAVNYYMEIAKEAKENDSYLQFYVNGEFADIDYLSSARKVWSFSEGEIKEYYKFTLELSAKQMTDEITAYLGKGDEQTELGRMNIRQYADYILENAGENEQYAQAADVVLMMLGYGAAAQNYFGYRTENLANAGYEQQISAIMALDETPEMPASVGINEGDLTSDNGELRVAGVSLSCESDIYLTMYLENRTEEDTEQLCYYNYFPAMDGPEGNIDFEMKYDEKYVSFRTILQIRDLDDAIIARYARYTNGNGDDPGNIVYSFSALDYIASNWNAGGALQDVVRTLYGFHKAVKQVWG